MKLRSTEILSVAGLAHGSLAQHKPLARRSALALPHSEVPCHRWRRRTNDWRKVTNLEWRQMRLRSAATNKPWRLHQGWLATRYLKFVPERECTPD
jgi:hypothetical protein